MATFLSYVEALGVSPAEVFQGAADISELIAALSLEEQRLISHWWALAEEDRRRVLECLGYLTDVNGEIRRMAQLQLDILHRAIYGERLKRGGGVSSGAEDLPASSRRHRDDPP